MLSGETSVGVYPTERGRARWPASSSTSRRRPSTGCRRWPTSRWRSTARAVTRAAVDVGAGRRRQVPHRLHRDRRVSARLIARYRPGSRCWPSPRTRRVRSLAVRRVGRRDLPRPAGAAHRRDGAAGRRGPAGDRPRASRATRWSSSQASRRACPGTTNGMRVHSWASTRAAGCSPQRSVGSARTPGPGAGSGGSARRGDRPRGQSTAARASGFSTPQRMSSSAGRRRSGRT